MKDGGFVIATSDKKGFKADLPYLLIIVFALFIFLSGIIFNPSEQIYPAWDWTSQGHFWKDSIRTSVAEDGELPMWNPYVFSGIPFLGHPIASSYYYPLNIFFTQYDPDAVFKFYLLFHLLLGGWGMFYFLKRISLARLPSLFGAIIFIYGAPMIARINYGQLTNVMTICYMPLLFMLLHRVWEKPRIFNAVLFGTVWGLQFTIGNVHFFYVNALCMGFYALYLLLENFLRNRDLRAVFKRIAAMLFACVMCMGIGAGQLASSLEVAAWSVRNLSDYTYATTMSLPVSHMLSFVFPNVFGSISNGDYFGVENYTELYGYMGLIPLILVMVVFFSKTRKSTFPWLLLGGTALLLSFGKYTPIYWLAYRVIPGLNLFRIPATFLFVFLFCLVIVASYGLSRVSELLRDDTYDKWRLFFSFCGVFLALVVLFKPIHFLIRTIKPELYTESVALSISRAVLYVAVIFALFLLFFFLKLSSRILMTMLIVIAAADLLLVAIPLLKTAPKELRFPKAEWTDYLAKEQGHFRLFDMRGVSQHVTYHNGIQKITGSDPILLNHYFRFTNRLMDRNIERAVEQLPITEISPVDMKNPVILDMLNVRYVLTDEPIARRGKRFEHVSKFKTGEGEVLYLYRNNFCLPRAWLVDSARLCSNYGEVLKQLADFDPLDEVLLASTDVSEADVDGTLNHDESIVSIQKYTPNKITLEVNAVNSCYLVLSEIWFPGWHAKVDGKRVAMLRANYALRAVQMPAGKHRVELYYRPGMLLPGMAVTFTTLFIALIFIVMGISRGIMERLRPLARKVVQSRFE